MKEKFNEKDEEVISEGIGFPYNVIPKGYPNKIADKKIDETIDKFLNHLKGNAGSGSSVSLDVAFINLGLNEKNNRTNSKQSKIAFRISIISAIFAGIALIISIISFILIAGGEKTQKQQLIELKKISNNLTD